MLWLIITVLLYVLGYVVYVIRITLDTEPPVTVQDLKETLGWCILWPVILLIEFCDWFDTAKPYDSKVPTRWQKFMAWEIMK